MPLHESAVPLGLEADDASVGAETAGNVGNGNGVGLGWEVAVGTGDGGTGVSDGIAAWVCATMVLAAAMAEACTWAGSGGGGVAGAQAANKTVIITTKNAKRFICVLLLLLQC